MHFQLLVNGTKWWSFKTIIIYYEPIKTGFLYLQIFSLKLYSGDNVTNNFYWSADMVLRIYLLNVAIILFVIMCQYKSNNLKHLEIILVLV